MQRVIRLLVSRKLSNLLYIRFPMAFLILHWMDIDLQIVQSIFDYFLYIGMTLAIFRTEGIYPVEKDIIKISINC